MLVSDARRVRVSHPALAVVEEVAVTVFGPPQGAPRNGAVFWCVPGGGMTPRYFDLPVEGYSMARHLTARGHTVITVDPPGVGDSDVPDDGWALLPDVVADVLDGARAQLASALYLGERVWVGVGHSAGGLLVARQQARHRGFRAVALLGASGRGLPDVTTDGEMACARGSQPQRGARAAPAVGPAVALGDGIQRPFIGTDGPSARRFPSRTRRPWSG